MAILTNVKCPKPSSRSFVVHFFLLFYCKIMPSFSILFFTIWVMFCNISRIYFFFLSTQNIESNCSIIFLNFFQSCFSDGKCIPSQLCLFIKGLISVILSECFPISSWFNATVTAYWKHFLSFLLIGLLLLFPFLVQSRESLYDPPRFRFSFYDICNTINEHNRR